MLEIIKDNRSGDRLEIVVFTYNEEARLGNILGCYGGSFDVVVLDGCSTDRTVEMALQAGATVFRRLSETIGEAYFVQYVNEVSRSGLCFYLLADEYIPVEELRLVEQDLKGTSAAVVCSKAEWMYGRRMLTFNHSEPRGFRKGAARYNPDRLHENLEIIAEPSQVSSRQYGLNHLHIWSVRGYFGKIGAYSHIEIEQMRRSSGSTRRFARRYLASLIGFPIAKVWRERGMGLPRALFWMLFDLAELVVATLSVLEQKYLMSPQEQAELYAKFYTSSSSIYSAFVESQQL
jgi:glycosyltransferase involved in cell wall biosynthesis